MHFEINKGTSGKPVYPFYKCPDNKQSGIDIINQGLCRTEMFQYNLDPIIFLEDAQATLPHTQELAHNAAPILSLQESNAREQLLQIAKTYLNSPYLFGGTGEKPGEPTDCSQYTKSVFAQVGIALERNSADQAHMFAAGGHWYESIEKAKVGDLVFFQNTYEAASERDISHVAIYAGNNQLIHASADRVKITPFDQYWRAHFKGVGSFTRFANAFNQEKADRSEDALQSIPSPALPESIPVPSETPAQEHDASDLVSDQAAQESQKKPENLISLDSSNLDPVGREFLEQWDIRFVGEIPSQLQKGQSTSLKLQITKKSDGTPFNGVLKQPIILVANSTNISIDPVAISLVKEGEVAITLQAKQT